MESVKAKAVRMVASAYVLSLAVLTGLVFFIESRPGGFHGFAPLPRQTILTLRTALAALAIFECFPLILLVNRRGEARDPGRQMSLTLVALALAESPVIFGLVLFLLQGAFKTFFAFLTVSAFYYVIAWPRVPD